MKCLCKPSLLTMKHLVSFSAAGLCFQALLVIFGDRGACATSRAIRRNPAQIRATRRKLKKCANAFRALRAEPSSTVL